MRRVGMRVEPSRHALQHRYWVPPGIWWPDHTLQRTEGCSQTGHNEADPNQNAALNSAFTASHASGQRNRAPDHLPEFKINCAARRRIQAGGGSPCVWVILAGT